MRFKNLCKINTGLHSYGPGRKNLSQMLLLNSFSFRKVGRLNGVATLFVGILVFSTIVCPPTIVIHVHLAN